MAHLDTHVVAWLAAGAVDELSPAALRAIDAEAPTICPAVELELAFLHEIGRLTSPAGEILTDLERRIGLTRDPTPFPSVCAAATEMRWTRDPFDRLIVAAAWCTESALITRDRTIREHYPRSQW